MMQRPLKVLMTADAVGGVWSYCLTLARAMQAYGVQYTLACMGPRPSRDQVADAAALANVRLEVSDYRLEWMTEPWADVEAAGEWLRSLEARDGPDLVHLNGYAHGACGFAGPAVVVGHSCCLSWWRAVKGGEAPPEWDEYRAQVSRGIACADAFIAPSAAILAEYQRLYRRLPRAQVIHNAADVPSVHGLRKEQAVLAAGRAWDEAKNIGVVAEAAAHIPWPTRIAGDTRGPVGSAVLPATVQQLGRLSQREMQEALARAAIYVHPARYEPFGLLPLEAAHQGCALVLADIPTLRELWSEAAVFFDPTDSGALVRSVRGLINSPERLAACARAAARQAQCYSVARFGAAYAHLYSQLVETTNGSDTCGSHSSTTRC
ncbi:MAG TPA: glycosyltransferase family 4 protein [Phycisphaerales bacterium]|nr:glycosyltransferase family 4 protein [Phycisphaerales bacterium]